MMKYIIILVFVFTYSCQNQNTNKITNSENDITLDFKKLEDTLLGKWEKLTIIKKDTVIFQPCDANNTELVLNRDSIKINYGQEENSYQIIKRTFDKKNKIITYKLSENLTIKCFIYDENKSFWQINDDKKLFVKSGHLRYKYKKQPCSECWDEDDCNTINKESNTSSRIQIKGNYSKKHELELANITYNDNRVKSVIIKIKSKDRDIEQTILYFPEYWYNIPQEAITEFYSSKDIIITSNGLEDYSKIIFGDFNFDKKEDFAIINYEGSNAGPQYTYFLQDKEGFFHIDKYLTNQIRLFPTEINNREKCITISNPVGCCKISTKVYQKGIKGWDLLSSKIDDLNTEEM